ncbi:MAG: hypothetical protein ACSLFL_08285, partial [Alphaproteobacteria bacterium]
YKRQVNHYAMAHPQHGYDTPELRQRRPTECPPRRGTYPSNFLLSCPVKVEEPVNQPSVETKEGCSDLR